MRNLASILLAIAALSACGGGSDAPLSSAQAQTPAPLIVVYGDSETAGMMPYQGVVQVRQDLTYTAELRALGQVITAAVGGHSTADAVASQLPRLRDVPASHVVIMLGTNDAVRGLSIESAQANINTIAAAYPRAKLVLVVPPYWDDLTRPWFEQWRNTMQVMALVKGAQIVDAYTHSLTAQGWQCHPADHHPCEPAHRAIGALITTAIKGAQ